MNHHLPYSTPMEHYSTSQSGCANRSRSERGARRFRPTLLPVNCSRKVGGGKKTITVHSWFAGGPGDHTDFWSVTQDGPGLGLGIRGSWMMTAGCVTKGVCWRCYWHLSALSRSARHVGKNCARRDEHGDPVATEPGNAVRLAVHLQDLRVAWMIVPSVESVGIFKPAPQKSNDHGDPSAFGCAKSNMCLFVFV